MVTTAYVSRSITIFRKYWFMWIHPIRYVMRQLYQRPQSVIPFVRNNNSGRLELRLPCGRYTFRGVHEYPIAVTSTVHSDSRIITGHRTVTIHIWEACYVIGTKFLPIAVFLPYGECPSTEELPNINHCIHLYFSHCITNYVPSHSIVHRVALSFSLDRILEIYT